MATQMQVRSPGAEPLVRQRVAPRGVDGAPLTESTSDPDEFVATGRSGWQAPLDLIDRLFLDQTPTDACALAESILAQQQPDGGWKEQAGAAQTDLDSTVLNHLALAKAVRRETFAAHPDLVSRMETALAQSWQCLTGQTPAAGETRLQAWGHRHVRGYVAPQNQGLLQALPRRVVRHLSQGPALMHETLLGHSLAVRMDRQKCVDEATAVCRQGEAGQTLEAQPRRLPGVKTLATVAATGGVVAAVVAFPHVALLAAVPAAQFVAGLVSGQVVSSGNESYFHDTVLHASKELRLKSEAWIKQNAEFGPVDSVPKVGAKVVSLTKAVAGWWVHNAFYGHSKTHHAVTDGKNYEEKLEDPEKRDKIMQRLERDGHLELADNKFGSTTNWIGYLAYQFLALPSYAVAGLATVAGGGPAFALGFAIPSALYPLYSATSYHDRVHTPVKSGALEGAPFLIKAYLKSWPSRKASAHHYRHHVWKPRESRDTNYNLVPFEVGDYARGVAVPLTAREEEDMGDRGLLYW